MGLPYDAHLVSFSTNDQMSAGIPVAQPEQQDPGDHRPARAGRPAAAAVRIRRDPDLPRREVRPAAAAGEALRDPPVADVPDGRHRPDVRPARLLPRLRRERDRRSPPEGALPRRGRAAAEGARRRASGRDWIAGDYSIADIAIGPWLNTLTNFYKAADIAGWDRLSMCRPISTGSSPAPPSSAAWSSRRAPDRHRLRRACAGEGAAFAVRSLDRADHRHARHSRAEEADETVSRTAFILAEISPPEAPPVRTAHGPRQGRGAAARRRRSLIARPRPGLGHRGEGDARRPAPASASASRRVWNRLRRRLDQIAGRRQASASPRRTGPKPTRPRPAGAVRVQPHRRLRRVMRGKLAGRGGLRRVAAAGERLAQRRLQRLDRQAAGAQQRWRAASSPRMVDSTPTAQAPPSSTAAIRPAKPVQHMRGPWSG